MERCRRVDTVNGRLRTMTTFGLCPGVWTLATSHPWVPSSFKTAWSCSSLIPFQTEPMLMTWYSHLVCSFIGLSFPLCRYMFHVKQLLQRTIFPVCAGPA